MLEGGDAPDERGCVWLLNCSCLVHATGIGWIWGSPKARSRGKNRWGLLLFPDILECSLEEDSEGYQRGESGFRDLLNPHLGSVPAADALVQFLEVIFQCKEPNEHLSPC